MSFRRIASLVLPFLLAALIFGCGDSESKGNAGSAAKVETKESRARVVTRAQMLEAYTAPEFGLFAKGDFIESKDDTGKPVYQSTNRPDGFTAAIYGPQEKASGAVLVMNVNDSTAAPCLLLCSAICMTFEPQFTNAPDWISTSLQEMVASNGGRKVISVNDKTFAFIVSPEAKVTLVAAYTADV